MESDLTSPKLRHTEWWGMPIPALMKRFRDHGVIGDKIYNTNGGMWIVRKEAIAEFAHEAFNFHAACIANGFKGTHDETPLAWLGNLWPENHELNVNSTDAIWACDWMGRFSNTLPTGEDWLGEDWMTGEQRTINPAIVHAMRSKEAMALVDLQIVPTTSNGGVGTELKRIIAWFVDKTGSCSACEERAAEMDRMGIAWCSNNVELIIAWLKEGAALRGLPFWPLAARGAINLAIYRARRATAHSALAPA